MEIPQCKICNKTLRTIRAKICDSNECKSKWKMIRNANLEPVSKNCLYCGSSFLTKDKRNNFCSSLCKGKQANSKRITESTNSVTNEQKISLRPRAFDSVKGFYGYKKVCESCNKEFIAAQWGNRNCSTECAKKSKSSKLSEFRTGKTPWNKGKTNIYSEETKFKMGAANKDKQLTDIHKKNITTGLTRYYSVNEGPNLGKSLTEEQKLKISQTLLEKNNNKYSLSDLQTFTNKKGLELLESPNKPTLHSDIKIKCTCGTIYIARVQALIEGIGYQRCKSCNNKVSNPELEILNFVKSIYFGDILHQKKPSFMEGKELDIYIPSKKMAIEHHGLAHHSERNIYNETARDVENKHLNKYKLCKSVGVTLLQIFQDEWRDKTEICKNMIKARLGVNKVIYARDCDFKTLTAAEAKSFFEATHISGDTPCKLAYGLFYKNELVSAISYRVPWNKKYGDNCIEIARYATKGGFNIAGGFQKLLKNSDLSAYTAILTYSDLRFGEGNVYLTAGFKLLGATKPNYFYEKNGIRENRFKHRKNPNLEGATEREQQNKLGWYAIYDCGSNIFLKNL